MSLAHHFAHTAHLIGHPSRALMLDALLGRDRLNVTELAEIAGITVQTASVHLDKLRRGGLVEMEAEGKNRLYRIGSPRVMDILQKLALLADKGKSRVEQPHQKLRICYGHMAGEMAVSISQSLCEAGLVVLDVAREHYEMTPAGMAWLDTLEINAANYPPHTHACLDWTEKTYHIAGWLGHEMMAAFAMRGYIEQPAHEVRALRLTESGKLYLAKLHKQA
ncbi:helix-turn-helix transcriptional regulator [Neisseria sp. 74A18]|uniref:ArsR/SmtB family transcription factor n=1 Tax=Neisseria sp. 74A18 TaxID=1696094 RepID=UPI0009E88F34|nr:winged helix-turn-helix domain-containing protein [Neisseria sp. 74A18]